MDQKEKEITIKINDDELRGVYANFMRVTHTKEEFVLDFANVVPPHGIITSRVITSPGHFKRIVKALQENLRMYESRFGAIKEAEEPKKEIGFHP